MKKLILFLISICCFSCASIAQKKKAIPGKLFTESFMQDSCTFSSAGRNAYFILEAGYQCTYEGIEEKDTVKLVITVLNETKKIGGIETRIVEENETHNGKTEEISRNYFALCKQTGNMFYFGEDVDMYKEGKVISHEGAWIAEGKNKAGIAIPGTVLLGSRYYQEIAPGVAMDRAEIISNSVKLQTPAGNFSNCVKMEETTPLEPKNKENKIYAAGVGLVKDGKLLITKYGFTK